MEYDKYHWGEIQPKMNRDSGRIYPNWAGIRQNLSRNWADIATKMCQNKTKNGYQNAPKQNQNELQN